MSLLTLFNRHSAQTLCPNMPFSLLVQCILVLNSSTSAYSSAKPIRYQPDGDQRIPCTPIISHKVSEKDGRSELVFGKKRLKIQSELKYSNHWFNSIDKLSAHAYSHTLMILNKMFALFRPIKHPG